MADNMTMSRQKHRLEEAGKFVDAYNAMLSFDKRPSIYKVPLSEVMELDDGLHVTELQ